MLLRPLTIISLTLMLLFLLLSMTVIAAGDGLYSSSMLYVQVDGNDTYLMRWEIDRNLRTRLTNETDNESIARWSPDGQSVAYIRWESHPTRVDGYTPNIYVMSPDGQQPRRIIDVSSVWEGKTMLFNSDVRWSPDGQKVAYFFAIDSQIHVWIATPDGDLLQHFVDEESLSLNFAQWSANSETVYVVDINSDYVESYPITDAGDLGDPFIAESPARDRQYKVGLSPAGRDIYVMNGSEIWRYNLDDEAAILITEEAESESFVEVTWSPDGEHIAYVARHWDTKEVYAILRDLDGNITQRAPIDINFTAVTYWNGIQVSEAGRYLYGFVIGRNDCLIDMVAVTTTCNDLDRQLSYWQTFRP